MTGDDEAQSTGNSAMILAAGLGTRMKPLSDTTPKPLIEVAGRPLINYAMDRLSGAGVETVVVNMHHLAGQIETWAKVSGYRAVILSDERNELLDTGGGVALALPLLGKAPFFVLNSDSFWIEGISPALDRMRSAWDGGHMDCLLLLSAVTACTGYEGRGDFILESDGRVARRPPGEMAPFVYTGCCLIKPELFDGCPPGPFSLNLLWDQALERGRLFGLRHDGVWIHVGTPDAIAKAERALAEL